MFACRTSIVVIDTTAVERLLLAELETFAISLPSFSFLAEHGQTRQLLSLLDCLYKVLLQGRVVPAPVCNEFNHLLGTARESLLPFARSKSPIKTLPQLMAVQYFVRLGR
jgi:hypothetical protein